MKLDRNCGSLLSHFAPPGGRRHGRHVGGIREVHLTEEFKEIGGTELAPMSTTRDLEVALQYGTCDTGSVLFRIEVPDALGLGADLRWVSASPGDEEVLYPPLTFLRPTHRVQEVVHPRTGVRVTVIEVTPDLSAAE